MKTITLVCEASLRIQENQNEAASAQGNIEARVTTWGPREGADGRRFNYQPEGFKAWAEDFAASDKPLPMFLNHNDLGIPVGKWTEFSFDEEGMTACGQLYTNTVGGSDLYQILKDSPGMFGGVSVGAYADEARFVNEAGEDTDPGDENAYFQITQGGLREVSVVMYPNNPKAEIQHLEAIDAEGKINPRILEKALRDAGLAKKDALTASSIFKRIWSSRDAVPSLEKTPLRSDSDAVESEADQLFRALMIRELEIELSKRLKN